jgi:hypothetical protein
MSGGSQAEMQRHRLEVAIGMEKRMTALDAERAYDQVDGLTDGDAFRSEQAIVCGGFDREPRVYQRDNLKIQQSF